MWQVAHKVQDSSPVYFKECISRTGHITLVVISENPFRLQLFPNTFMEELYYRPDTNNNSMNHDNHVNLDQEQVYDALISTDNMERAIDLGEQELAVWGDNNLDYRKLRSILSDVIIDPEVDSIIDLTVNITRKHNFGQ
ncbi:hypothetical protein [Natranaerobius thermophilus]|uniref:Uncharacterized protein n=1 Tax=Natranaerobius thermophilus (strain ATCC BAA-1301 / DSM 18059 / JW/NM-WN-LF) TaxID=457570 RepID=B2A6P3_NATTJ|nr:hypothetical protein [Natranaerobius thermophilus]ACB84176.1 hypothetical protein Nther_0581 [Natranaerobius thermophilus JW/NM-WN-LF]